MLKATFVDSYRLSPLNEIIRLPRILVNEASGNATSAGTKKDCFRSFSAFASYSASGLYLFKKILQFP
jgi:hypothetical protein